MTESKHHIPTPKEAFAEGTSRAAFHQQLREYGEVCLCIGELFSSIGRREGVSVRLRKIAYSVAQTVSEASFTDGDEALVAALESYPKDSDVEDLRECYRRAKHLYGQIAS